MFWDADDLARELTRTLGDRTLARAWAQVYFATVRDALPAHRLPALHQVVPRIVQGLAPEADATFVHNLSRDADAEPAILRDALRARLAASGTSADDQVLDRALDSAATQRGLHRLVSHDRLAGALGRQEAAESVFDDRDRVRPEWTDAVRAVMGRVDLARVHPIAFDIAFGRAVARVLDDAESSVPRVSSTSDASTYPIDYVVLTSASLFASSMPLDEVIERIRDFVIRARGVTPSPEVIVILTDLDISTAQRSKLRSASMCAS